MSIRGYSTICGKNVQFQLRTPLCFQTQTLKKKKRKYSKAALSLQSVLLEAELPKVKSYLS